ncbi:MAG: YHS domain-containing (seleno)protein [Dokdonia sp.]|jgi:YHS domain-containing protein|nr:hypothetical protein [Cytophagaceae bacterium]
MKTVFSVVLLFITTSLLGQQTDYNLKKGYAAEGYDVVAYFDNQALEGDKRYVVTHDGARFKFANSANANTFKAAPEKYIPQYGGYCAYAIAVKGEKVGVNPETFEIRDGKLYLFYNSWGTNTLEKWLEENPKTLQGQADAAWNDVKYKS